MTYRTLDTDRELQIPASAPVRHVRRRRRLTARSHRARGYVTTGFGI